MKDLDLAAIDLTVDDRDPQAIFDAMLGTFQTLAPTARVPNGSLPAILFEAFATGIADLIYAANRISPVTIEGVLTLRGVPRFAGAPATGAALLTLNAAHDLTVTVGQRLEDPTTGLLLEVTTSTTVTASTTITVPLRTVTPGAAGNAIPAGAALNVRDAIPYVASATVSTAFTGGADAEDDAAWLDRCSAVQARVTSSLVLPEHFTAYCVEDVRVNRATAIDLYQPGGTVGLDAGHVTEYVYGYSAQLSTEIREELRAAMHAISSSLVTIHVEPASLVTQAVTYEVTALAGYDPGDLETTIDAALTAWMNPNDWAWGEDVRQTDIIALLADIPGVDFVDAVTAPAGTTALAAHQLATIGTITGTVNT